LEIDAVGKMDIAVRVTAEFDEHRRKELPDI